jgi:integrating conjugative element membrane protein (TIGR03747 family)
MADPASAAQRQEAHPQGLALGLLTLPLQLFGVLAGSLLLSVSVEWIGMHWFWPRQSWHHAQAMLDYERHQISSRFTRSLLLSHPGRLAERWICAVHEKLFAGTDLKNWAASASAHAASGAPHLPNLRRLVGIAATDAKPYALAAGYTLLTFLARLLVLTLALPLFVLAAGVGFVDGLVRRDLRRFGAGHESGFLYHRAKAAIVPLAVLPWVLYLALPVSVPPLLILLPGAALLSVALNITAASFKKYL